MTPRSRSPLSLYGHHKRLAGPALTTKFSKLIDNRRPLHEFSQHDHAAGFAAVCDRRPFGAPSSRRRSQDAGASIAGVLIT